MNADPLAIGVFFVTLFLTFLVAIYARTKSDHGSSEEDLAGRSLNKWLIGLSAGATGNSGFIVTGAVGLGYVGGVQWLLLPLGWLIGDLLYWAIFPKKINVLARESGAITLPDLLTNDLPGKTASALAIVVSLILVTLLLGYTAAQWLAGQKFLSGMFELNAVGALVAFGSVIVFYTAIGGFRGSIYVDTFQAIVRIIGTILAVWLVWDFATGMGAEFHNNISAAGPDFLNLFAGGGVFLGVAFALGFAGASIGFGLGQPQIISRYMAGATPEETAAARWIYIGFLQFTWLSMTVFGIILRGVQPEIADPEEGLSLFFSNNAGAIITGIIFADVFATIAATANSILVTTSQIVRRNLIRVQATGAAFTSITTLTLGLVTIGLSFVLPGNVFSIAISAVSQIGAGIGAAMLIKLLNIRHSAASLLIAIMLGTGSAVAWSAFGLSSHFNETLPGMLVTLVTNFLVVGFTWGRTTATADLVEDPKN